jgi:DNA adenine methylase
MSIKPFLKWVGGKTQIIDTVLSTFPSTIHNYYEPFLGGGSVLLALLSSKQISGKIYASDINESIIRLYQHIQSNPEEFIVEVNRLSAEFSQITGTVVNRKPQTMEEATTSKESYYYWIRSRFNAWQKEDSLVASAMLLFLNKTCFRGLYREGPNGFNVPYGNYKSPSIIDADHIREVSRLIRPVIFSCSSFEETFASMSPGDFAYFDPPYAPETATSFVQYTAAGFTQHQLLFDKCAELTAKHIRWTMSNADVEYVKKAFPSPLYKTSVISCRRAINSKNPESRTNEVLIYT